MLLLRAWVELGAMAMKGAPHSPKLQHHWNLTIRLFSVISRTLIRGVSLTSLQRSSRYILQPQPTGQGSKWIWGNGNKGIIHTSQNSRIGVSRQDSFVSYLGHLFARRVVLTLCTGYNEYILNPANRTHSLIVWKTLKSEIVIKWI